MARGVGCSHTTLSKVFCSPEVPSWDAVDRVVRFLHGDTEQFRRLWYGATGGSRQPEPVAVSRVPARAVSSPRGVDAAAASRPPGVVAPPRPTPGAVAMTPRPVPPSLATLRRRVTRSLDQPLGSASHGDIGAQLDRFEQVLLALCARAVLDVLDERAEPAGPGVQLLHVGGRALVLKLRPDLQRERTLRVTLQDVASPDLDRPDVYVEHRTDLGGSIGRFDTIRFTLPRELEADVLDGVRNHLLVTLSSGYEVLERRAAAALAATQSSLDRALFDRLREPLAGLADGDVWLLIVTRQRVCLAVSPDVVSRVLQRARGLDDPVLAPVQQVYRILADPCPLDVSLRQALHTGRPVPVCTAPAPVLRRDDLLGRIFAADTDAAVVPLAVADRVSVLAACPLATSDAVADAVAPLRDEIARLAEQY